MLGNIYKKNFNPDNIALKYKGQNITYGELDKKVHQYAAYFSGLGIEKGSKVVLSCLNSPEFIYSYLGIVSLGAIVVPINLLLTIDEMVYIVKNSEAKTMILHPTVLEKLSQSKDFKKKLISSMVEKDFTRKIISKIIGIDIILLSNKFKKKIDSITEFKYKEVNDESLVSTFLYTSGTTGKPKAAMLTHHNIFSNVVQTGTSVPVYESDNMLSILPMFHVFGFTICVLVPLYYGASLTILESFQPKELIDTVIKEHVTVFSGVPSMYVVLIASAKNNIVFPDIRIAICGGASLPVETYFKLKEKFHFPFIEGYGLSEASPLVTYNDTSTVEKVGSIGIPIHGVECRVVDDTGNETKVGEVGELIVKGDNVMIGYYKQEEQTKEALKDGWLYTGDMAKKDEDGYYYIVERKKDLVIVGGLNVYPKEVEEAIYKYPKVKEAAVVGISDELRGEYVKAFVVLKDGMTCHSKELLRFLKEKLAQYKLPREIEFINELPKNATGKILKRILKEQHIKK